MSRKKLDKNIKLLVGFRIRDLRKINGFSQEILAEMSDVDYKHIQLLEGKKPSAVKIDTLEKICNAFKIQLKEFFDDELFD